MIVGILGGGQLARMLAEAARPLGLTPIVYTQEKTCPAGEIGVEIVSDLSAFVSRSKIITFENEFVDCEPLHQGEDLFFPSVAAIETLQDKFKQKQLLKKIGVPHSPFKIFSKQADLANQILSAKLQIGDVVLKWSRMGYDGKGVCLDVAKAQEFCADAWSKGREVFGEKKIDFVRELAVIGCVSKTGEGFAYPLVITEQKNGICRRVMGPATSLGVSPTLQAQAEDAVMKIAQGTGITGCFGIEFFETRDGELLVNEIAPRVHNTGHYTQNAMPASQFENHWRAILGMPLCKPRNNSKNGATFYAMLNLLGSEDSEKTTVPKPGPRTHIHWYGKRETRIGRKMGHLNGTAGNREEFQLLLDELDQIEKTWSQNL